MQKGIKRPPIEYQSWPLKLWVCL